MSGLILYFAHPFTSSLGFAFGELRAVRAYAFAALHDVGTEYIGMEINMHRTRHVERLVSARGLTVDHAEHKNGLLQQVILHGEPLSPILAEIVILYCFTTVNVVRALSPCT